MDPVSQAALGAAWAQPVARGGQWLVATVLGGAAGMAADLDTLIRSDTNPMLALQFHRHFTHSLVFAPVGAALCAVLAWGVLRRRMSFTRCYAFALLGFASHGLLDACTSYGTMLLWPFSDVRVAWNLISVVDPLFTLPLIVCLVIGLRRRTPCAALIGICWCLLYLGFGGVQQARVVARAEQLASGRGHDVVAITAKPTFANLVVWKTYYVYRGHIYIDAVRAGGRLRVFEGESFEQLDPARDFPAVGRESTQGHDMQRFLDFADGFVALASDSEVRIVDVRYSLVPNRGTGFWGLELDPDAGPGVHASYVTMRWRTLAEGRELLRMVFQGE